ncbi:hypothetical protein [Xenorhabdus cabanillasii]|uniref:hypothetical protein n=1 Tax=Xenorhabdus cabanillasii TaxID=351673 RepID=UPI001E3CA520|nr:hypothetical protein [Xenorhabdus cabanillasii]
MHRRHHLIKQIGRPFSQFGDMIKQAASQLLRMRRTVQPGARCRFQKDQFHLTTVRPFGFMLDLVLNALRVGNRAVNRVYQFARAGGIQRLNQRIQLTFIILPPQERRQPEISRLAA